MIVYLWGDKEKTRALDRSYIDREISQGKEVFFEIGKLIKKHLRFDYLFMSEYEITVIQDCIHCCLIYIMVKLYFLYNI